MPPSSTPSATVTQDEAPRGTATPRVPVMLARYLASPPSVTERLSTSPDTGNLAAAVSIRKRDTRAMLKSWERTLEQAGRR
ncbi:hypothetical protein VPNG_07706 [Cytospora leucostoma]|uniref:Uncharacterized protein n=1 Tax=Cytospora leucostoma TaxID=1230097 RepID=A0A423W877_9PEZI|nr:hypothetical protein VPNG_07706 [Cytospora leucostoma]